MLDFLYDSPGDQIHATLFVNRVAVELLTTIVIKKGDVVNGGGSLATRIRQPVSPDFVL